MTESGASSIRFPHSGHIRIPAHGRRAAAAGVALHSSCKPLVVLAQRFLYTGVRLFGPGLIPGERVPWSAPLSEDNWGALLHEWGEHVGLIDSIALYHRPQAGRIGFSALLLRGGRGVGFARVSTERTRIAHEATIVRALNEAGPRTFQVANLLSSNVSAEFGWMLSESVPNYPLGAVRRASTREAVVSELSEILDGTMDRPAGTPAHWVPAHGDLAPWNLRTRLNGDVQVIDWEDAGYAPPGVDLLYGALTAHVAMGTRLPDRAEAEARAWVDDLLTQRIDSQPETANEATRTRAILRGIPIAS